MPNPQTTNVQEMARRAELAAKIAESLMNFPLQPRPGDDANEYYRCLKVSFTFRITEMLNEADNARI